MNKKYSILIILSLAYFSCFSQFLFKDINKDKITFNLNGNIDIGSNHISGDFIKSYYNSKYLSHSLCEKNSNHLQNKNVFGLNFNANLYCYIPDTNFKNFKYIVGLEFNNLLNLKFGKEAFDLYFFGNSQNAGTNVLLNGIYAQILNYQQLKVGFYKHINKNSIDHYIGGCIGFNKGQNNFQISADNSSLYTDQGDEFIDATVSLKLNQSDSNGKGLSAINGSGGSLDLFYKIEKYNFGKLEIFIKNIGFIKWNKSSIEYSIDSSYHFEGIYINDIIHFNTNETSKKIKDSLINSLGIHKKAGRYTTILPFLVNIAYKYNIPGSKFSLTFNGNYMYCESYNPFFMIKPTYNIFINPKAFFEISPLITYGGFSSLNCGLEINFCLEKNFYISIGSQTITSMANKNLPCGYGGYLTICKSL